jgi:hypothetical protein
MDRINGAGTVDIGGGRRGFRDENLGAGVEGTEVTALWLNMVQEEILKVITEAGLTPDPGNWTQLDQAIGIYLQSQFEDIMAALSFATTPEAIAGLLTSKIISPKTLADVLGSKLPGLAKLSLLNAPNFPHIQTSSGKVAVSVAGLSVSVDAAQTWMHRGVFRYSSDDYAAAARTFATVNGKTYHLRWTPGAGFALKDLADAAYNPGALAETDPAFDSTFDDMLIAKVTAAAGVATVTTLINALHLKARATVSGTGSIITTGSGNDGILYSSSFSLNWARTPTPVLTGVTTSTGGTWLHGYANAVTIASTTRYAVAGSVQSDYQQPIDGAYVGSLYLNAYA